MRNLPDPEDMVPKYKVLVHKSLLDDNDAIQAITDYLWWGELPEDAPIKITRRRNDPSCDGLFIFDPADGYRHKTRIVNGYIITDLEQW